MSEAQLAFKKMIEDVLDNETVSPYVTGKPSDQTESMKSRGLILVLNCFSFPNNLGVRYAQKN